MPLVVNSNISSLNAQRQLVNSGAELDRASERLASGKRINSAADDAAGLAISNRQTSQIRGLDQAIRNANDGMSMIQTAEGAIDETTNILQRMRELAVQSSNGLYSDVDRATLDAEVQQLKEEITRIAESTTFNGQKILDGSRGEMKLQVGADAGQTIGFTIGKLSADGLGGGAGADVVGAQSTGMTAALTAIDGTVNTMTINGQAVGNLATGSLQDKLDEINKNVSGVEVGAITEMTGSGTATGIVRGADVFELNITGADGSSNRIQVKDTGSMDELVSKINSQGAGLVKASLDDDGNMTLSSGSGATIAVTAGNAATAAGFTGGATGNARLTFEITDSSVKSVDIAYGGTTGASAAQITAIGVQARTGGDVTSGAGTVSSALTEGDLKINGVDIGAATGDTALGTQAEAMVKAINEKSSETGVVASVADSTAGTIKLDSVSGKEIKIEATTAATTATGLISANSTSSVGNSVADLDIGTMDGAQKALGTLDRALEQINSTRADMGAIANRLDFTMSNLSNVSENSSAARSRILDADFAQESAALSRAQVLQQASQAMLAQANARPQQVLSLLQ